MEFIKKLNQQSIRQFRLPTEAEWEYAARSGGRKEKWAGTSQESELEDYAWYEINSGGATHPAGLKKPNGLGIYDMSGNVGEWCSDWWDSDYYARSAAGIHHALHLALTAYLVAAVGTTIRSTCELRTVPTLSPTTGATT